MNVLVVHNKYKQKGGEDVVVANEVKLLEEMGYTVFEYIRSNDELDSMGLLKKICLPFTTIFSIKSYKEVYKLIKEKNIDILHVHNTLCVISPSVYYAGFKAKIPVFQTIAHSRVPIDYIIMLVFKGRWVSAHTLARNQVFVEQLVVSLLLLLMLIGIQVFIPLKTHTLPLAPCSSLPENIMD